jgi:hypothetical protein
MVRVIQEEQIFGSLSQEKTLHSIVQLAVADVLKTGPAALRPTPAFEIPEYHFADMEIPWILGGLIYVVCGLNELGPATVPGKVTLNVPSGDVPSFRKAREPGPDCCCQKVYANGLIQLPCY